MSEIGCRSLISIGWLGVKEKVGLKIVLQLDEQVRGRGKLGVKGQKSIHVPSQDLQKFSHSVEMLRLINKTRDRQDT